MRVKTSANTDGAAKADGASSDGGSASVGLGVAINLANVKNEATVHGTVVAQGLVVDAAMVANAADPLFRFDASTNRWVRIETGDELPVAKAYRYNAMTQAWERIDEVDELATETIYRHNPDTEQPWVKVDRGAELPGGPNDGDVFELTAEDTFGDPATTLAPGVYRWNNGTSTWDAVTINGANTGTTLPATSAANDVFKLVPAANVLGRVDHRRQALSLQRRHHDMGRDCARQ